MVFEARTHTMQMQIVVQLFHTQIGEEEGSTATCDFLTFVLK